MSKTAGENLVLVEREPEGKEGLGEEERGGPGRWQGLSWKPLCSNVYELPVEGTEPASLGLTGQRTPGNTGANRIKLAAGSWGRLGTSSPHSALL